MKKTYATNRAAIIIAIGAGCVRCGFAGEYIPRTTFELPPDVHQAFRSQNQADLEHSLTKLLLRVLLRELLTVAAGRAVALCRNTQQLDDRIVATARRVLLNKFRAKEVVVHCNQLLALYPTGSLTGIVLDCGKYETRCCPVVEGYSLHQWAVCVPLGVQTIIDTVRAGIATASSTEETEAGFREWIATGHAHADFASALPVLFNPQEHVDNWTVCSCLLDCLLRCDRVVRPQVVENVVLSGVLASAPGFRESFCRETLRIVQDDAYVQIRPLAGKLQLAAPRFPSWELAWVGAALVHTVVEATALHNSSPHR